MSMCKKDFSLLPFFPQDDSGRDNAPTPRAVNLPRGQTVCIYGAIKRKEYSGFILAWAFFLFAVFVYVHG
jgi:hypothetical protein